MQAQYLLALKEKLFFHMYEINSCLKDFVQVLLHILKLNMILVLDMRFVTC